MTRIRLDKLLSSAGYGSRKEVKRLIKRSMVQVDNRVVLDPGLVLDPDSSRVLLDGKPVIYKRYHYLMMNKPQGVLSATRDNYHRTLLDLLEDPHSHLKLFPVGRLDIDTQGLIILTDDGPFSHSLSSPNRKVPKTYYAELKGELGRDDQLAIERGLDLGDFITSPGKLEILESGPSSSAKLTIYEGKFHQVKRMFLSLGKEVTFLKRLSIGPLELDESLAPGSYRELTEKELTLLKK